MANYGYVVHNMKIHYELTGTGWADGYITFDSHRVGYGISYMSDALGDLTDAILYLMDNFGQEVEIQDMDNDTVTVQKDNKKSITWEGEPWGHIWDLELRDDLTVQISFRTFENLENEETLKKEESLQGTLQFENFVIAVVDMLETVLKTNGFVGYKTIWHSHEFPIGNYLKLKDFLDNRGIAAMTLESGEVDEDDIEKLAIELETRTNLIEEIEKLKNTVHNSGLASGGLT